MDQAGGDVLKPLNDTLNVLSDIPALSKMGFSVGSERTPGVAAGVVLDDECPARVFQNHMVGVIAELVRNLLSGVMHQVMWHMKKPSVSNKSLDL